MKSLVFGSRRSARAGQEPGPLDAALAPALVEGRWRVPGRFNFTRDVVEVLAEDTKRVALTAIGRDGVIEPRTFHQLAEGAARWTALLHERGVRPGDCVLVVAPVCPDWVEVVLGTIKAGAIVVPCSETLSAASLDARISATRAPLVVASHAAEGELLRAQSRPDVVFLDEARSRAHRLPKATPTHDTSVRDPAFVVTTAGRGNVPRGVLHSHGSTFAARAQAEHWLDVGQGDVVWCSARADSAHALLTGLFGPWARGAEIVLQEGAVEPVERLELVHRLGVTVLCQRPDEYAALAETRHLARYRSARPRRLVSSGASLDAELIGVFEEQWGLTIHDGYELAEAGVVAGHTVADGYRAESAGRALPGYALAVVDDVGRPVPPGEEGELAVRGRPPTLFTEYWKAPAATKAAFHGDFFLTGDLAAVDEDGCFWLLGRKPATAVAQVAGQAPARVRAIPRLTTPQPVVAAATAAATPELEPELPRIPRPRPVPVASEPAAETERGSEPMRRSAPLWARATAVIWLLLLGMLVGGAAIPHANDQPRVVPKHDDAPNAICLPPKARG